jgi:methionine-S-sulfoxide reductase
VQRFPAALIAALVVVSGLALTHLHSSANPVPKAELATPPPGMEVATFAGGCFWSMEYAFDKAPGVKQTVSGFMGGTTPNPTYAQVSHGNTGHAESVQVTFDPKVITYPQLVDHYFHHVDLLDGGGQFCDRGDEYRPVIFVSSPEQRSAAEQGKAAIDASHRFSTPVAVSIADAGPFTAAEDYHQNFHNTNEKYYKRYRAGCGHDRRLKELWGSEADKAAH